MTHRGANLCLRSRSAPGIERGTGMDSGPAIFAGAAFALFGAALLVWTGARVLHRAPVAHGVSPATSITLATLAGASFLVLGVWCFGRI